MPLAVPVVAQQALVQQAQARALRVPVLQAPVRVLRVLVLQAQARRVLPALAQQQQAERRRWAV